MFRPIRALVKLKNYSVSLPFEDLPVSEIIKKVEKECEGRPIYMIGITKINNY